MRILNRFLKVSAWYLTLGVWCFMLFTGLVSNAEPDDLEFAEALAQYGYHDLAMEVVDKVLDSTPSPQEQYRAKLIEVHIKRIMAGATGEPEKIRQYLDEAIIGMKQLVATAPQENINAEEVKFELGELLQTKGDFLSRWIKIEMDATKKEQLKTETESVYNEAGQYFGTLIEEFKKQLRDLKEEDEEIKNIETNLTRAQHLYPVVLYSHALMYDKSVDQRAKLLKQATRLFDEFMLINPYRIRAYKAANYAGLCYLELGEFQDALGRFEGASFGLWDMLKDNPAMRNERRDIIQEGFYHMAQVYNMMGEYNKSIQTIGELFRYYPDAQTKRDTYALYGVLERARAFFSLEQPDQAFEIVNQIIDARPPHRAEITRETEKIRSEFITQRPEALPPEFFLTHIKNLINRSKYTDAVEQAQKFITTLTNFSSEDQQKYIPNTLFLLGEAYSNQTLPRIYEARLAYETLYQKYPKAKDIFNLIAFPAARAAYQTSVCYTKIGKDTHDENDFVMAKKIRHLISRQWPESDIAKEIQYYIARDLEIEEKYLEAAQAYAKVRRASKFYVNARANEGRMYYGHAKEIWRKVEAEKNQTIKGQLRGKAVRYFNTTEEKLKTFLQYVDKNINGASVSVEFKNRMRVYQPQCLLVRARVCLHETIKKYTEVLELLKGFEKKWKTKPRHVFEAYQLKIEAWLELGDLTQAENNLKSLQEWAKKYKYEIPPAPIQLVALGLEEEANKIVSVNLSLKEREKEIDRLKKDSPQEYARWCGLIEKSINYFIQWMNHPKKMITPKSALTTADKFYRTADELSRVDYYKEAANIYEGLVSSLKKQGKDGIGNQKLWQIRLKLAHCYTARNEWVKALTHLEDLDRNQNMGFIKKQLGLAYEEAKKWNLAFQKWSELVKSLDPEKKDQTPEWWNARYHVVLVLYKAGQYQDADNSIKQLKASAEDFDKNEYGFKDKFIDLWKKIKEILPGETEK